MAHTQANAKTAHSAPLPAVPALAPRASSARIPTTRAAAARRSLAAFRRGMTVRLSRDSESRGTWRLWADLARGHLAGYVALLLARLPGPRPPRRTLTVFVAPLTERPDGSAPR
ncbi:hypothetical protein ACGFNV_21050 [Streptomyces sp. NPDC048751]|uniref:hypothetical protein n=1 Tax=Streptomyces sp. NPDC048751 TaxID=3365591 RepID=UPI0037162E1F